MTQATASRARSATRTGLVADRILEALAALSLAAIIVLLFGNATLRFAANMPCRGWRRSSPA